MPSLNLARPLVCLGLLLSAGASLAFAGCADHKATGVTLALTSELSAGVAQGTTRELDSVQIFWDRAGNQGIVNSGPIPVDVTGIAHFPATITFNDTPDDKIGPADDRLKLTIEALTPPIDGVAYKIVRQVQVSFVEEKQKLLTIPLQFSCINNLCQQDLTTCVAGECVPLQTQEGSSLSDFDESAFNVRFTPPGCLDAKLNGCFAGAVQVKPSGIRIDPDNTASCEFDIPNKGSADLDHLNVGIVWAEANGRYTVLDFNQTSAVNGWTAVPQKGTAGQDLIKVTLPKSVCDQVKFDASGRVKGVVYAINSACSHKEPAIEVCADATDNTSAANIGCTAVSSIDPEAIKTRPCLDCAIHDTGPAGEACSQDAGCQAVALCTLSCQKILDVKQKVACQQACLSIDLCDPSSKDKAQSLLVLAKEQCKMSCGSK